MVPNVKCIKIKRIIIIIVIIICLYVHNCVNPVQAVQGLMTVRICITIFTCLTVSTEEDSEAKTSLGAVRGSYDDDKSQVDQYTHCFCSLN